MSAERRESTATEVTMPSQAATKGASLTRDTEQDTDAIRRRAIAAFNTACFLDDLVASILLHRQRKGGVC